MIEGPISNNKENKNVALSPPLDDPQINMKFLIFKFEGSISNNKENKNFVPPPRDAPGKKYFFEFLRFIWKLLVIKFEGPISNNKENKMFVPPPWDALVNFFFEFL